MNFKQNFLNNSIAIKNNLKHLTYLNLLKKNYENFVKTQICQQGCYQLVQKKTSLSFFLCNFIEKKAKKDK